MGDLERLDLAVKAELLTWNYAGSTLTVMLPKPQQVLDMERNIRNKLQALNLKHPQEGDLECTTQ